MKTNTPVGPLTSPEPQRSPRQQKFRIQFYGFVLIVAVLVSIVVMALITLQNNLQAFEASRQSNRASIKEVQTESAQVDAVWHSLKPTEMLTYQSPAQHCLETKGGHTRSSCLPKVVFGKLQVTSNQPPLVVADKLASWLQVSGWSQRHFTVNVSGEELERQLVDTLPAQFQHVRLSYRSPHSGDKQRCISLIYASEKAQSPGWSGYIGTCSI